MPSAAGLYYAYQDGPQKDQNPVVLLHGAGGSNQSWPAEIRRLTGQQVLALDLPGHGRSQGVGLQSIGACADQVIEFLTALGLYQAVLVGHGMGGAVAIDIAIRYEAFVSGLGLIASGAYLGVDRELVDAFSNPYSLQAAFQMFQQRAFTASTSAGVIEPHMKAMKTTRPSVLAADWRASAAFDRRGDVAQISAPAWIIAGSDDRLTPVAYSHFLAGSIPAAHLQVIPYAGHMVIVERPQQVAQGIQQFITALTAVRRSIPNVFSVSRPQEAPARSAYPAGWDPLKDGK